MSGLRKSTVLMDESGEARALSVADELSKTPATALADESGETQGATLLDESGETLAETLVSLLIIAGLFACLATAVVTSAGVNKKAQEQSSKNEFFYTTQDGYEVAKSTKGEVTFAFDASTPSGSATDKNANKTSVDFYTTPADDSHDAYSYYEPKAASKSKSAKTKSSKKDSSVDSSKKTSKNSDSSSDASSNGSSSGSSSSAKEGE